MRNALAAINSRMVGNPEATVFDSSGYRVLTTTSG